MSEHTEFCPVGDWENAKAKGMALCGEETWQEHVEMVNALRARQEAYRASLPTEPAEAIRAARKLIQNNYGNYPEGFEDALHLSVALATLVQHENFATDGWVSGAAQYIAEKVMTSLHTAAVQIDRAVDILEAPTR